MGFLYFCVAYFTFTALSASGVLLDRVHLYNGEMLSGSFATLPFYLSTTLCDILVLRLLAPVLFVAITYFMVGLQATTEKFLIFLLTLVLIHLTAVNIVFTVSSLTKSTAQANFILVLYFIFSLSFAPFMIQSQEAWVKWVSYGSFIKFAYEILAVNEFAGLRIDFNPKGFGTLDIDGQAIIDNYGLDQHHLYPYLIVLVGYSLFFFLFALVVTCRRIE